MKKNNRISSEVLSRLSEIADQTENYTGAELEGLVRNAASFSLARSLLVLDSILSIYRILISFVVVVAEISTHHPLRPSTRPVFAWNGPTSNVRCWRLCRRSATRTTMRFSRTIATAYATMAPGSRFNGKLFRGWSIKLDNLLEHLSCPCFLRDRLG